MNFVVASCRLDQLLCCLGRLTTPFQELPPGRDAVNISVDGYPVLVGEFDGLAYLIEDGGTAFACCWGLLARAAQELEALVIGSVHDPTEEHCEFFVAQSSRIVRAFWSNPRRTTWPFSQGTPLASEAWTPLSASDGRGLMAALEGFGFPLKDEARDLLPGERWVTWKGDLGALLEKDALGTLVNDHVRAFANPDYQPPVPRVRMYRVGETEPNWLIADR
jgi:hypothetical protein